ncbi:7-cyano-7-deazaguanine synthase [Mesorhizobium sp. M0991]|uniref:hypothetical protein n=1 Tax=Mesorhizobium sp. M0991 TaxID=2957043 RepID=UPI00333DB1AC
MHDTFIACGGAPAGKAARVLELDISPAADEKKRVRFDPGSVSAPLLDEIPDPLADVLEIAAYVFSADRLVPRVKDDSREIGAEWQRRLRFRIPVRNEALWNSREVKDALLEGLSFLSGDEFAFEFTHAGRPEGAQLYLGFNDSVAQTIRPDQVILFSGGLDSLAGVSESVIGRNCSAVLVTHSSATLVVGKQNQLAHEIGQRTRKGQTFYAPVWVRRGHQAEPVEHSQRLRSFLFASLGMAYARMFGCSSVQFCENGITSFNLPMAQHVVGTRASRTTHPRTLSYFSRLFSLLLDTPVSFENPFLWKTKADVVRSINRNHLSDLIGLTTSCANIREMSMSGRQCGYCSQCVERQYAVAAAGLFEPIGTYERDLFLGAHQDGRDLTMVEAHLCRAQKLAAMSQQDFMSNNGQVYRALTDIGESPDAAASSIFSLHQRYGSEIVGVVDEKLRQHATLGAVLDLPETSLLGLLRSPLANGSFYDTGRQEPPAESQAAADAKPVPSRRIVFALDEGGSKILFDNSISLNGRLAELISRLAEQFEADLEHSGHTYVSKEALCRHLHCEEETLRQIVTRTRKKLEREFEAKAGYTLDLEDVIQSRTWTGYRLNPFLLLVDRRQLSQAKTSRHFNSGVTTPSQNPANSGAGTA